MEILGGIDVTFRQNGQLKVIQYIERQKKDAVSLYPSQGQ